MINLEKIQDFNYEGQRLQTESGFYPEKIYKNMGFKEIFKGVKYTEI